MADANHDVLIAEDEPLAADMLADWVKEHGQLNLVGVATDGISTLELITELQPKIVLMDINMPGQTGLQVAKALAQKKQANPQIGLPAIIFTTAYDEYALTAFELHAVDYLLKPFSQERFIEAVNHAISLNASHMSQSAIYNDSHGFDSVAASSEPLTRIMVRDQGKIFPVKLDQVAYLKSDTKYTAIAYQGRQFLVRLALQAFEERLDKEKFLKLQRSCIVNLDFVESMTPDEMSQYVVKMQDGTQFTASREVSKLLRSQSL
jgi:two-component system, LytTR family, response regulator